MLGNCHVLTWCLPTLESGCRCGHHRIPPGQCRFFQRSACSPVVFSTKVNVCSALHSQCHGHCDADWSCRCTAAELHSCCPSVCSRGVQQTGNVLSLTTLPLVGTQQLCRAGTGSRQRSEWAAFLSEIHIHNLLTVLLTHNVELLLQVYDVNLVGALKLNKLILNNF